MARTWSLGEFCRAGHKGQKLRTMRSRPRPLQRSANLLSALLMDPSFSLHLCSYMTPTLPVFFVVSESLTTLVPYLSVPHGARGCL